VPEGMGVGATLGLPVAIVGSVMGIPRYKNKWRALALTQVHHAACRPLIPPLGCLFSFCESDDGFCEDDGFYIEAVVRALPVV